MITLYHRVGTCSNAVAIALRELNISHSLQLFDNGKNAFEDGSMLKDHHPLEAVPALKTNDETITEVAVILQYLADSKGQLIPEIGTATRYKFMETLSIISTEFHKSFYPIVVLKYGIKDKEVRKLPTDIFYDSLAKRYQYIDDILSKQEFIFGDTYTIADTYLSVVLGWAEFAQFDDSKYKNCSNYQSRIASRPAIIKLREEKLI